MGNLCNKEIPHVTLSCVNTGMVSSCCRSTDSPSQMTKLYKYMYTVVTDSNILDLQESHAWYVEWDLCYQEALHQIKATPYTRVQLFIYKWNVGTNQPLELVLERQILQQHDETNL